MTIDINELRKDKRPQSSTVVHALLDRLEAAESECLKQARLNGMGSEREAALLAKLGAAEKSGAESLEMYRRARGERDALRAEIEELHVLIAAVKKQADAEFRIRVKKEEEYARLCAKVEQMERQKPIGTAFLCVRCSTPFDGDHYCPECGHHTATEESVYAIPGAQPAPSVPEDVMRDVEWKRELFIIKRAMAMNNWDWKSEASNDMKRAAYAAVVKLLAAAQEAKP